MRNWTQKTTQPNSLEKEEVKPAIDMFRPEVTAAIEMHSEIGTEGFGNVASISNFTKEIHKWVSIHDILVLKNT